MLKAESLGYHLRGKPLIHDISMQFHPGILYGILGPNGSGKTTLLKAITGIWMPTSGRVLWHGKDLHKNDRRMISKTVSLVPHNTQIAFDFSVTEMVGMGRYPHGSILQKKQFHDVIEKALEIVDISHLRERPVSNLSSGEKQRVYIARALVTESPVLLLDEPTASLDIRHQLEIWKLLKELLRGGKIIIVTGHDLAAMERHADQIAVMNEGRCVAKGNFTEILSQGLLQSVFGVVPEERGENRTYRIQ